MVDPRVVADLARGHPPGARADDHRVQPAPSSSGPWRYRARRQASRPGPGAPLVSKGPTWRVDGPGSWSRPRALAAGRCRRLSLLHGPGCSVNSARRPRPRNLLGAERGAAPGPRSSRPLRSRSARTGRPGPRSRATAEPHRARRRACSSPQSPSIGVSPSIRAYTDH